MLVRFTAARLVLDMVLRALTVARFAAALTLKTLLRGGFLSLTGRRGSI
jgi:hypothetical protein